MSRHLPSPTPPQPRRLLAWLHQVTGVWKLQAEPALPLQQMTQSREAASIPSFGYLFLIVASTVIATLGLILNSAAVIIGAMIVAPLMNPILSISFGIVTGNTTLYRRSIVTALLGSACCIVIATFIAWLAPIQVVGTETLSRISPNLIDLGVAIAAGAAGAFSLTRASIASSIAGVAIAVALVPPLCVVGLGLGLGESLTAAIGNLTLTNLEVARGAFLLFLANLLGITVSACVVFLAQAYGSLQRSFQGLLIWALLVLLLMGPLTGSLKEFALNNRLEHELHRLTRGDDPLSRIVILHTSTRLEGRTAYVEIFASVPEKVLDQINLESAEDKLFAALRPLGINAIDLTFRLAPVRVEEFKSISPP